MACKGGIVVTFAEIPFFMTNKEWYYADDESGTLKLTEKAPPEAVQSYKEFYKELDRFDLST